MVLAKIGIVLETQTRTNLKTQRPLNFVSSTFRGETASIVGRTADSRRKRSRLNTSESGGHVAAVTAYIEWDEESGLFVGIVPGIVGAHTQGATLAELDANLREVLELCVEEGHLTEADVPRFVGLHQIEVAV